MIPRNGDFAQKVYQKKYLYLKIFKIIITAYIKEYLYNNGYFWCSLLSRKSIKEW